MTSSTILSVITFVYAAAAFFYILSIVFKKEAAGKIGSIAAITAALGNLTGIILRWIESYRLGMGHAPLSNLYESLVFFAFAIVVIYLVIERKYKRRIIGAFVTPLAFAAMAYASLNPNISDQIRPLIPALKSNWLIAHVITCFIGYAAFAIGFGLSIMYLFKARAGSNPDSVLNQLPRIELIDELTHQVVMFGFLFLSMGIISGSVWAYSAWGRYWGWDPKETWSLITWFIYLILLHCRLMAGWRGTRIALISIVGFLAVLFTYFGVNYLPGLHSYGVGGS